MQIGVIIHSKTGTTLKFAELIASKLTEGNHSVDLVELKTAEPVSAGSAKQKNSIRIVNLPDCAKYEALLLGGPVWGFAASPVIIDCIEILQGIAGKKILPFVTMGFPLPGMGGKQAVKSMSNAAAKAGAIVLPGLIITKMFHDYYTDMEKAAATAKSYFTLS